MVKNQITLSGSILDEQTDLTLGDLCRACAVHAEWLEALVDEGILEPTGANVQVWRFTGYELRRARTVRRLQQDLGVNLAGAALAIQLLEELEHIRSRLAAIETRD